MKKSLIPTIFWALIIVFIIILCEFFVPVVQELFVGPLFLLPIIVFSLTGIILFFLTLKEKKKSISKKFLMLTGAASGGFFVGIFLHNAFYALATITLHIAVLNYLLEAIHVAFFLIATVVCPLAFLVGAVGSIILFIKNKNRFLIY